MLLRRSLATVSAGFLRRGARHICTSDVEENGLQNTPWLFVGIGNPGSKFIGTRHNVGFEMIEAVSRIEGIVLNIERHRAIVGEGTIADFPVVLAKPQTYANLIGESVVPLMEHYNVPVGKIVVMVEDMNVRIAKLQLVLKGGHGDHKGLINLIAHLQGNRNFPRLRMGIGLPPEKMDPKAFVLQRFCEQERKMIDKSILQGVDIVRVIATHGVHAAIDSMNKTKAAA